MTDSYFMLSLKAAVRKQQKFCFCFYFLLNSTVLQFVSQNTVLPCVQQANSRAHAKDHGRKAGKGIQGFPRQSQTLRGRQKRWAKLSQCHWGLSSLNSPPWPLWECYFIQQLLIECPLCTWYRSKFCKIKRLDSVCPAPFFQLCAFAS